MVLTLEEERKWIVDAAQAQRRESSIREQRLDGVTRGPKTKKKTNLRRVSSQQARSAFCLCRQLCRRLEQHEKDQETEIQAKKRRGRIALDNAHPDNKHYIVQKMTDHLNMGVHKIGKRGTCKARCRRRSFS
jgi:hypothetical protein